MNKYIVLIKSLEFMNLYQFDILSKTDNLIEIKKACTRKFGNVDKIVLIYNNEILAVKHNKKWKKGELYDYRASINKRNR